MAGKITKLIVLLSVFSTLFFSSSAQTCNSYSFSSNQVFSNCQDLPVLSSFLHWNYDQSTGKLTMAYRHTDVSSTTWVSWAINPNSLSSAMPGAQALVAVPQSGGAPRVYTSPIQGYQTTLAQGNLTYEVTDLTASYQNNEMIIFATWTLPTTMTTINQVWQAGPVSGTTLGAHSTTNSANLNSKSALNLLSGESQSGGGNSRLRKRNVSKIF